MIYTLIIVIASLFIFYLYQNLKKRNEKCGKYKVVPAVKGIPIIGVIPQIKSPLHFYFTNLSKIYGPIFKVKFGLRNILSLNDFNSLKAALKTNGNTFSGRWSMKLFKEITHDSGIMFTDGEKWAKQRAFVIKVLRDFGIGKSTSFESIQNECDNLLDELETLDGKALSFFKFLSIYILNIISQLIMNKRFSRGDPKIELIENLLVTSLRKKDFILILYLMFPMLDNSTFMYNIFMKFSSTLKMYDEIHNIFKEEIESHSKSLDYGSEGDDLMDRFLLEQKKMKEKCGNVDTFTEWQLIRNSFELFIAGYETTSATLVWSFLFMCKYPDIQEKVYKEIINQIGNERKPKLIDKKLLNYTQAVMDEVLRMSSVIPLEASYKTLDDSIVDGYLIPKSSLVFVNLYACHYDGQIWERPLEFYPEHFLINDNSLEQKYNPREELIAFGMGKRQCLGESLARMEYFIFFTNIIQSFKVSFAEEINEDKYQKILLGDDGAIRNCTMDNFIFTKRNN